MKRTFQMLSNWECLIQMKMSYQPKISTKIEETQYSEELELRSLLRSKCKMKFSGPKTIRELFQMRRRRRYYSKLKKRRNSLDWSSSLTYSQNAELKMKVISILLSRREAPPLSSTRPSMSSSSKLSMTSDHKSSIPHSATFQRSNLWSSWVRIHFLTC